MKREEIQHLLRQRPFQPFRVVLSDGRSYDIRYPRMNLLAESFIKIGIPDTSQPVPHCHHTEYVRLDQITRVEPLPGTAASSTS